MQEYPHVVEVPPGTSHKIERDAWIKESYGEQANSVFEDTTLRVNTKARWAAWYGYRFRDPSDAIHFKLRWH